MPEKPTYEELEQRIEELENEVLKQAQAGETLPESEEGYRSLIHKIQAAVVVHGSDTQIIASNPKAQELLGLTENQMLGKASTDPDWKFLNADGERMSLKEYPINQVLANRQPLRDLTAGIYRSNKFDQVWVLVNADPVFDDKGEIQQVIVTFMDVTEQKQAEEALRESEEKYRGIVEDQTEMICRFKPGCTLTFVNVAYARNFGKTPDEMMGVNFLTLIPEQAHEDVHNHFSSFSPANPVKLQEHEVFGKTGEIRWQQWSNRAIFDDNGNIVEFQSVGRDITDRKLSEVALQKTEHEKEAILDSLLEFVVYMDPEMKILWANQAACESVDLTRDKLIGRHCYEFWADSSQPCVDCAVIKAMKTGETQEIEKTTPDGKSWFNRGHPVRDAKNNIIGGIEVVLEITERKRAEEAQQASERNYREIFDATNDGIIIHDMATGRIVDVNNKLCELLGYSFEEVMDLTVQDLSYGKPPFTENEAKQWIKKAIEEGPQLFEWLARKSSGELIWLEINLKRAEIGGKDRILAVDRDISERKQAETALKESEETYRLLVNNLPGFVYKGFKDWSVEFYDNRVALLTGYEMDAFNSRSLKWSDLIAKEDLEPAKQTFIKALKTDKSYVRDYRLKTKADNIIWIQERGYIVCNQDGDIEYISGVFYDITGLKTAEEELRTSRALLHSTIESLPFDFFAMGQDGRYILQNSLGKQRWGNIVGKRPEDLAVRKDNLDSWLQANRQAFSGETVKGEIQYVHKGKQEIHHSIVAPIVSEGEILGILGANIDITDRKQVEEKIKKSEKKYRELWEGLRNGAVAVDMEGRIIEFNPAFQRMLGYDTEEIHKLTYKDITPQKWHPIDAQIFEEQVFKKGYSDVYEKEYIKKDGGVFPVELRTYLIQDDAGNPEGMWATISDITDRKLAEKTIKESEERYRNLYRETRQREQLYESLLNSTPDAVAIYNLNGETIFINPAFTRIFGFTMEDVQSKRIPFVPESEADKTKAGIEKVLAGEPVTGFETRRMTKDDRILDISLSSSCYYDHEGSIAGILVFLRDVTATKHIEKQLLHYNKMEAVGTLAGGIAHDFNNLLQAIQGYSEILLLDRDIGASGQRELQQISHAAKRGSELTRQLLTFSRKVESKKLLIDLNREVKQAHTMLKRTIPKMIDIELRLDENLNTTDADPAQVEQIIMNLAINAKDAMPEGGRLIIKTENAILDEEFCRTHLGSSPGDYVLLTVSDTGHGMDKKTLEHIFDPFFTTKEVGQGTGLGLAIVYGIVKSHHGYITSHSELGQGTTLMVYFPAVEQPAEPQEKETGPPIPGGTETILLVDDEKYIRDLATQMLEQFGYKVLTAVDGESALDLYRIKQDKINLAILDLIMPGMGGKQCLAELLKLDAQVKVVVISGYSDTIPIQETIAAGAKDFIAKPFKIRNMLAKIRDVLDE